MFRILEITWLTVAIFSFVMGIYVSATKGFGEGYFLFICTIIGGVIYFVRRKQRIAWDKQKKEKNSAA